MDILNHYRFQKRLQLNLLQLVDSAVIQFKTTQKNPNAVIEDDQNDPKGEEAHEFTAQGSAESKLSLTASRTSRKKSSSFSDMPKI